MELANLTDLQNRLKRLESDPALLELALRRASNRFRGAVGHPVERVADDTAYLNGDGTDTLHLPARPVDVHAVKVDGTLLVPVRDYSVDRNSGVIRRKNGWFTDDLGNVEVVYDHGYADIPGDIQDAVLEQASTLALHLAHLQQNSAGSTQESYAAQATVGTTAAWTAAVERYRVGKGDRS